MKSNNKFYKFFKISKLVVFLSMLLLVGSQFGFAALGLTYGVMSAVIFAFDALAGFKLIYLIWGTKAGLAKKALLPVSIILSVLDIALAVFYSIIIFYPGHTLEVISIVIRFLPILGGLLLLLIFTPMIKKPEEDK